MNADQIKTRRLEEGVEPSGGRVILREFPREELTLALIGRDARIAVCTSPMGELCGCVPGELLGKHWSVLCSDEDEGWLEEFKFGNPALAYESRCYVGLPGGDGPVRVGELNLSPLPGGGWLWLIGRVSAGAFPPFSSDELKTLLGHCFHSIRGPLTSASTAIQMLSHDLVPHWSQVIYRRCGQALDSLSSAEETIEDCSVVLESVLGTLADEARPTGIPGFFCQIVRDRQGGGFVAVGVSGPGGRPLPPGVEISLRQRLFRCLFLRILRLCERFKTPEARMDIEAGLESPGLRIQFLSPGMVFPEAIASMLQAPLSLHGPECRQSAFFFHIFVIGLILRELRGSIEVSECPAVGGSTVLLVLPSPSAVANEIP